MIEKQKHEDQLLDEALAEIEALPIRLGQADADAIAISAVVRGKHVNVVIEEIIQKWAIQFYTVYNAATAIKKRAQAESDDSRERLAERRAMTPSIRLAVLQRDKHQCKFCGAKPPDAKLHVDHILPVIAGGKTIVENLQVLCEACNLGKATKLVAVPTSEAPSK